jgi:pyruvate dehydrogenase E1 component alpha subunit
MISSSVGSQLLHAVGWAMGRQLAGSSDCALVYFGDGATSEGDFHEAMNFAGVFKTPVVFLCQNNQWAISVPLERQTAAPIWRKAEAYGFPGEQVDGNDCVAVHAATWTALKRARSGNGPTLIEALTYRVGAHSTADDPSRYRASEEPERWRRLDPVERMRSLLLARRAADEKFFAGVEQAAAEYLGTLRSALTSAPEPDPNDLFEFVFSEPPATLVRQREELQALVALEQEPTEPGG